MGVAVGVGGAVFVGGVVAVARGRAASFPMNFAAFGGAAPEAGGNGVATPCATGGPGGVLGGGVFAEGGAPGGCMGTCGPAGRAGGFDEGMGGPAGVGGPGGAGGPETGGPLSGTDPPAGGGSIQSLGFAAVTVFRVASSFSSTGNFF